MKLKYQWPLAWLLIFLLPLNDTLALSATGNTLWQHLLWPLVHANTLHWLLNVLGFMSLWAVVTPTRLICGYLLSVAIGYLYTAVIPIASSLVNVQCSMFNVQCLSLCGISGIIFFLLGVIYQRISRLYRFQLTLAILASCFIPGIASGIHIISLIAGILYRKITTLYHPITSYSFL